MTVAVMISCWSEQLPELEAAVVTQLLPKDAADTRSVVMEVRAGTGGDEAALFAAELLRMYELFCASQGWRFEVRQPAVWPRLGALPAQ